MYEKLSGMTGTAATEADEFTQIYKMEVVSIPTHKDMIRDDENDYVYKTKKAKYRAVVEDIVERNTSGPAGPGRHDLGRRSPRCLSGLLNRRGIPHNVLNAKHHEREAEIIRRGPARGAVTIATNMAGRGMDIKLGEGVAELGGLYVVGTERHEAAASTTSSGAARGARATPASRGSSCLSRTSSSGSSAATACTGSSTASGSARTCRSRPG